MSAPLAVAGDLSTVVTDATSTYATQMGIVAVLAIGVGVGIWGVRKGWGYFKSLSH